MRATSPFTSSLGSKDQSFESLFELVSFPHLSSTATQVLQSSNPLLLRVLFVVASKGLSACTSVPGP